MNHEQAEFSVFLETGEFPARGIPETTRDVDAVAELFHPHLDRALDAEFKAKLSTSREQFMKGSPLAREGQRARAQIEWEETAADEPLLAKSFSGFRGDELDNYRVWFAGGVALGKSAGAMLNEWRGKFPHAREEVVAALTQVAAEF